MTKGERMASDSVTPTMTPSSTPDGAGGPIRRQPPLEHGELVTLLQRLSVELDAFLADLGVGRESSGNRESSRRL